MKRITDFYQRNVPVPFGSFFMHALCFYILAMCLRIKPIIGILGALAFGFASYEIIIIQAGHNTKSMAVAFMPAALGAFIYAYQREWKLGALLSVIFMSFQIGANHLQVTYYFLFLLLALGVYFFIKAYKEKELKKFFIATGGLFAAYMIALSINYSSIATTNEYAKYSIRGENDLTVSPEGKETGKKEGLDLGYITNWSWGKSETLTLLSPYSKGSHSFPVDFSNFSDIPEDIEFEAGEENYAQFSMYWGDQPGTSGPTYVGVVVIFLAVLALVLVRTPFVWVLFGVSTLAVFLSWGKNLMWLTELFVNNIPLYNKFRTVTIILVLVEMCLPILAMLSLQQIYENREKLKEKKKAFLIASGAFLVLLVGIRVSNGGDYTGAKDLDSFDRAEMQVRGQIDNMSGAQAAELGIDKNNAIQVDEIVERQLEPLRQGHSGMKKIRKEIYNRSANRTILIGLFAIGLCALFFYSSLPSIAIVGGLVVLLLADLIPVDRNYLGEMEGPNGEYLHWMDKEDKAYPVMAKKADEQIMEMELLGNEKLKKLVKSGEAHGKEVAADLEYDATHSRRIEDLYRYRALAAATNYRVVDLTNGWYGAWNSSGNAYLHKSIGGYHGAKLRRIQNLFEFHLRYDNQQVKNMLNIKYEIRGDKADVRPEALGNAWAVKEVKVCKDANAEIRALGTIQKLTNKGEGKIFVNDAPVDNIEVTGRENIVYLLPTGDSLRVPISPGVTPGTEVLFVTDRNGKTNLIPKATLAMDTLNSFTTFVEMIGVDNFNPAEEAVMVESEAKKLSARKFSGEAQVKMKEFAPNSIKYDVNAKGKQLIVFSEIYHPAGWKAMVDGKEVDILKVNYLLRGVEVDGGNHKVELVYENPKAVSGKMLATSSSILLILFVGGLGFLLYREKKQTPEVVEE